MSRKKLLREKMALRIQHDLWHIHNGTLWLDLKLLLLTPLVPGAPECVLMGPG